MSVLRLLTAAALRVRPFFASIFSRLLKITGLPRLYRHLRENSLKTMMNRTVSLMLIISILTVSTPAAPTGLLVSINELGQDIRYSYLGRNFGETFLAWFNPALILKPFFKKQEQAVAQVVILPNGEKDSLTVLRGQKINFTAVGLDKNGQPASGVPFVWSVTDAGRKLPTQSMINGNFNAKTTGTFVVVAGAAGKQAQVTVTVKPEPGFAVRRALEKAEPDRTNNEKKFLKSLTDKGGIKTREISSKNLYDPEEERKLYEEEKQIRQKIKLLPALDNAVPAGAVTGNGNAPVKGGPSAGGDDTMAAEETAQSPASEPKNGGANGGANAAPMVRPPDDDGWNGSNWNTADDPGNQVGNPPGAAPDMAAGNGNFQLSAPVIALPGRGIDLNLSLNYNSRLWSKSGNTMSYDADKGFPAPGWSLGFGKMMFMGGNGGCMLVDADGTRHGYGGSNNVYNAYGYYSDNFSGHTADGSFINYSCYYSTSQYGTSLSGSATLPNGTTVSYGSATGSYDQVFPTQITDAQGNYITISYVGNRGPNIQTITDTLGRVVNFNYDGANRLVSVTAPGLNNSGARTAIRLHYNQLNLNYAFAGGLTADTPTNSPYILDAIYYPGTNTGYWFGDGGSSPSYSSYGMIAKAMEMRAMGWSGAGNNDQGTISMGTMTKQAVYNYPLGPDASLTDAPTYTSLTESWAGMDTAPAITSYELHNDATPRTVTVTQPNLTKSKQYSYNAPGQWTDGLIYQDETYDGNNLLLSKSVVTWGQGSYDTARPVHMEMTDERNQTTATDLSYGANYNQLTSKKEYDYNNGPLLRETRSDYENNAAYTNRHIFNLVKTNEVYDGAGTRVAKTDYEYDNNAVANGTGNPNLKNTPNVIMHNYQSDPFTAQTRDGACISGQFNHSECTYEGEQVYVPVAGGYYDTCTYECYQYEQISAYDPNTVFRGNVTKVTNYPDALNLTVSPVINTKQYDETGNLVAESASCCELKAYNFDTSTQYAYPSSASRGSADPNVPIRNTTSATYDYNTGLITSSTDPNGRTTTDYYDAQTLRPTFIQFPEGGKRTLYYDDAGMDIYDITYEANDNIASRKITFLNGLGQTVYDVYTSNGGAWNSVQIKYDNLGRQWKTSMPYLSQPTDWTTTEYDALGRTKQVTAPDGSVSQVAYNEQARPSSASASPGETVKNIDAWGRERWSRTDALGRLVEVVEPDPNGTGSVLAANNMVTRYAYDTLGNLVQSNQGGGQMRYFAYDALGRMTRQKLSEQAASLNDAGNYIGEGAPGAYWSGAVVYDTRSNIIKSTDARGVVTNYSYQLNGADDPLNRLQSVSHDLSGAHDTSKVIHTGAPPVTYQYMTSGDQDRLWKATAYNTTSEFTYNDPEGRVSDFTQTISSRSNYPMVTSYGYDTLSRVTDVRYPAEYGMAGSPRKLVHNSFDEASRLTSLTVDGQQQAGDFLYNASSQTTQMRVGIGANQLTEEYSFDQQTGLMTNQKVRSAGGTSLLDLSYGYQRRDQNGNLIAGKTGYLAEMVNNLDRNKDRKYEYDSLGRLTKASGGAAALGQGTSNWTENYTYDIFGNRTSVTASGQSAGNQIPTDGIPNVSYNTLNNRITTAGFEYDNNGNQTRALAPDGQTWYRYEYDDANHLIYIKQDNGTLIQTQEFGIGNNRLSVTDAATNQKTYYQGSAVEYTESNNSGVLSWSKSYVYLGDSLLSTTTPNGVGGETIEYSHPDALGTRLVSNAQTGTTSENVNLPFGSQIQNESTNTTNKRKFTSYDRSAVTGLDYAQNRTYDSKQGRFTQVDPIGISASSLMNPQSLNLYAYCGNDPVNHADPSGLFWGFFKKVFKWAVIALTVAIAVVSIIGIVTAPITFAGILGAISAGSGAAASVLDGLGFKKAGMIFGIIAVVTGFGSIIAAQQGKGMIMTYAERVGRASADAAANFGIRAGVGAIANFAQTKNKKPKKRKSEPGEGETFCYTPEGQKVVFKPINTLPVETKNMIIEAAIKEGVISGENYPNAIDNVPIYNLYWIANMESSGVVGVKSAARNSTARGLYQINRPNYGLNPNGEDSFGNGVEEAQGGIRYIKQRYKNFSTAVAFWKKHCYY